MIQVRLVSSDEDSALYEYDSPPQPTLTVQVHFGNPSSFTADPAAGTVSTESVVAKVLGIRRKTGSWPSDLTIVS
jgi:hypothetical protein